VLAIEPAAHGIHALALALLYCPAGQSTQAAAPDAEYLPSEQMEQLAAPTMLLYEPAARAEGGDARP
jgi:hypothetical protein